MITELQQSVFKRYHSEKHLSEFYLQDGGKKSTNRYGTKLRHCMSAYVLMWSTKLVDLV